MSTTPSDPMEFLKSLWGNTGMPLPGLVTPTLDTNELEKRIADLKAVEGWLKTNLGMLQMTVQGLEMQRATLAAMQAMSQSAGGSDANANPFFGPPVWRFSPGGRVGFILKHPAENDKPARMALRGETTNRCG